MHTRCRISLFCLLARYHNKSMYIHTKVSPYMKVSAVRHNQNATPNNDVLPHKRSK